MTTHIELPRSMGAMNTQHDSERGPFSSIDDHYLSDAQPEGVIDGSHLPVGQTPADTHQPSADGAQLAEANEEANTQFRNASAPDFGDHSSSDTQETGVAEPSSTGSQGGSDTHGFVAPGGFLRDPVLGVLADVVDDLETVRIANANRVRQLTRMATDSDGEERGFGLTEDHPEVAKLILTVKALSAAEHDAILNMQRALRKHPMIAFQKRHKGIGEKQLARLLAVIGDPYWHDLHQRHRTVSELWAYCGFHVLKTSGSSHRTNDAQYQSAAAGSQPHAGSHLTHATQMTPAPGVAPKRQRGQRSNWSEDARKRVWVIASAMPKFPGGHYEAVYRSAREKYADSTHGVECTRCGPKGKPAPVGSPLSDGHKHARAIRITAKEILKDLWIEARDLYASSAPVSSTPGLEAAPLATEPDDTVARGASNVL